MTRVSMRRFSVTCDQHFTDVVRMCGDPRRPSGWIDEHVVTAFTRLHHEGHAHSVEVWEDEELVGGLYGVQIGQIFAGESMFHTRTNASKVALAALAGIVGEGIIDTQWLTDHLASVGAQEMPRSAYLELLAAHRDLPEPHWPVGPVVT